MTSAPSPAAAVATALVGSTSTLVLPANLTRLGVFVFNPNASLVIWIAPALGQQSAANPGGTVNAAVAGGAGSIPLQPQQGMMLGPPSMPAFTNALAAICGTPNTPLTMWEFYP